MMRKYLCLLSLLVCLCACREERREVKEVAGFPEIFPDYNAVTIPVNIAPLNFMVQGADKVEVEFFNKGSLLLTCRGEKGIDIPLKKWRRLLAEAKGNALEVKVFAKKKGQWEGYKSFPVNVVADSVDSHLAYRLIEPGYELGSRLCLMQRELSSFQEKAIVPAALVQGSCVNCHSFGNYSPDKLMFHVRWDNPGTIVVKDGKIKKINTKGEQKRGGAYRMWHPSGDYIAFSCNNTYQAFHAFADEKIEVYDLEANLMVYDVNHNKVLVDPRFNVSGEWFSYPAWSPDGKFLYFCKAKTVNLPQEYKEMKAGIYRVGFDVQTGVLGDSIEPVIVSEKNDVTAVYPAISPDGRYLLYTTSAAGVFLIHHEDADLKLWDLQTQQPVDIGVVNSNFAESYHAWSSSGRWVVFSSRRIDNMYTQNYLAYFDREGRMHKPFVLPQKDPEFYKLYLRSFNVPEFIKGEVTVSPYRLQEAIRGKVENAT